MNARTATLVVFAMLLPVGSLARAEPTPAAPAAPPAAPAAPRPAFRLLEVGAEPRVPLRLAPAKGLKQTLTMRLEVAMELSLGGNPLPGQPMPAIAMPVEFEVLDVRPNGDFAYAFRFGAAEVDPGASEIDPVMLEMYKASLSAIKGSRGGGLCSNRGQVLETRMEISTPDLMSKAVLESLREPMKDIVVPLPEEAVGVGAKWEQRAMLNVGGIAMEQVAVYTLRESAGGRIAWTVEVKQAGGEQSFESPMMPGVPVKLLSIKSTSTGRGEMKLAKITPEAVETKAETEANIEVEPGTILVQKVSILSRMRTSN